MYSEICFDIAAIIITLALVASLLIRGLTKGRANRLYLALVFVTLIASSSDLLTESFGLIIPVSEYNLMLQNFLNYIYFISRNASVPLFIMYIYAAVGIWHLFWESKHIQFFSLAPYCIALLLILSNPFTHWIFYFNDNYEYNRGPYMSLLYGITVFYLIIGVIIAFVYRNYIETYKSVIIMLFIPLAAFGMVVQMIYPSIRIDLFIQSVIMLVIAVGVQRPEEMIDSTVNTQSYKALLTDANKAYASNHSVVVLMVKITNFSSLRNHLGLANSLIALNTVSEKIQQLTRLMRMYSDVYYLDSGTFAILNDSKHEENIIDIGRILIAFLQEPLKIDEASVMVNVKIAFARCPDDLPSIDRFINFAHTFHEILPDKNNVILLEDALHNQNFRMLSNIDKIIAHAIVNNGFEMYYQPIYSIKSDSFVSAEALIRLHDPDYGFVSPGIFIPAAEVSGAIHQIGDYVLKDVCRFISENEMHKLGLHYIEVNLSVAQCIEKDLVNKVRSILRNNGVRPSQINLEITETAADYDREMTDANITGLAGVGMTFSLDDYGTGYSNIKRIVTLPLSIVKLDKSLVDERERPEIGAFIRNTVGMLKKLNKKILVEGVETEEAYRYFVDLDCDYIQGYYFSKPLPEAEFKEFLMRENHK